MILYCLLPLSGVEFDAIDQLGRSVDELKFPPPQPTSKEYGAYLHRQQPGHHGGGTLVKLWFNSWIYIMAATQQLWGNFS